MPIGELFQYRRMRDVGRDKRILWEQWDSRDIGTVAREKIAEFIDRYSGYNTPSIWINYMKRPEERGLVQKLLGLNPVKEEMITESGEKGSVKISALSGKSLPRGNKSPVRTLDGYLNDANCVYMTFMVGTHHAGNCALEYGNGKTRVGTLREEK
jgi:hypothetical protein